MSAATGQPVSPQRLARRRRRLVILVISLLLAVIALTYLETRVLELGSQLPGANASLLFVLINANALLLLLLLFLTGRNIVTLVFERRAGAKAARLKTKLVLAFVGLSLIPTGALFFVTLQFINTSVEYWFNIPLEKSLSDSLLVGRLYYRSSTGLASTLGQNIASDIDREHLLEPWRSDALMAYLERKRDEYRLSYLRILNKDLTLAAAVDPPTGPATLLWPVDQLIDKAAKEGQPEADLFDSPQGDYVFAAVPIGSGGMVVLARLSPHGLLERLKAVAEGLRTYQQLKMVRRPIKMSHYVILSLVALIIIFGAIWFGFRLAKSITIPLMELAEGTERVAAGDYDFTIEKVVEDEIGLVVESFNRMTGDLKSSREQLDQAHTELIASAQESEAQRRNISVILANVAAGVVSTDADGVVTTVNRSAERILGLKASEVVGRPWREAAGADREAIIESLAMAAAGSSGDHIERQVRLTVNDQTVNLLIRLSGLRDEAQRPLGWVMVVEDLTELEQAQRMAAWREVARRIAHEIKNPLTPIKLSAQRLKKRFGDEVGDKGVFDQAVTTIVGQVDQLKSMVDEFSSFARMPAAKPSLNDLIEVINETAELYRQAHGRVEIDVQVKTPPPSFYFDQDQLKRVLINLLDNSVAALTDQKDGRAVIRLHYLADLRTVRLEVVDNGPGIRPQDRDRLFDPYFSTKQRGTGLGLAIVQTIIQDHHGYIRVQDNTPIGTKFIIELPVMT